MLLAVGEHMLLVVGADMLLPAVGHMLLAAVGHMLLAEKEHMLQAGEEHMVEDRPVGHTLTEGDMLSGEHILVAGQHMLVPEEHMLLVALFPVEKIVVFQLQIVTGIFHQILCLKYDKYNIIIRKGFVERISCLLVFFYNYYYYIFHIFHKNHNLL